MCLQLHQHLDSLSHTATAMPLRTSASCINCVLGHFPWCFRLSMDAASLQVRMQTDSACRVAWLVNFNSAHIRITCLLLWTSVWPVMAQNVVDIKGGEARD